MLICGNIRTLALAVSVLWLWSCRPTSPEAGQGPGTGQSREAASTFVGPPAGPGDSPSGANPPSALEQPASPRPLSAADILGFAAAIEPSGRVVLDARREIVVDPAATFEVELSARSDDARLVLLDGRDAFVAATNAREIGNASTRLTLVPATRLTPGSRYVLRVDGAGTRELHDAAGRAYGPIAHPLLAAGTPPPKAPEKKPPRRRRRH